MTVGGEAVAPVDRPAIVVESMTKEFVSGRRRVHAVGPIDLTIAHGEFVCIVGPSGCGKSTLLRMIADLVRPSSGQVRVRRGAGRVPSAVVFQEYSIFPWKTVEANIRLGLDLAGADRRAATACAREWAEKLGLGEFLSAFPATLSGGMRQRVAIARALAMDPGILLMDEPFAALDAQLRQVLQEELLRVWESDHRTVLFVTHSLEEAALLGDRVVVMSNRPGTVIADRPVPFERPRPARLRASADFADFREELWELLRGEVSD